MPDLGPRRFAQLSPTLRNVDFSDRSGPPPWEDRAAFLKCFTVVFEQCSKLVITLRGTFFMNFKLVFVNAIFVVQT